jgi:hypothetical protein
VKNHNPLPLGKSPRSDGTTRLLYIVVKPTADVVIHYKYLRVVVDGGRFRRDGRVNGSFTRDQSKRRRYKQQPKF